MSLRFKLGRSRRKAYRDCRELHLYEEEIVMRAIEGLERGVTAYELDAAHPDRFKVTYLTKTLNRLFEKDRLIRRPGGRGGWSRRGSKWRYAIRPDEKTRSLREERNEHPAKVA